MALLVVFVCRGGGEEAGSAGATGGRRRTAPRLWAMLMLLLLPPLGGGAGDGVDGLPSRLLFVGLAAGAGSAERGKNGGRPREGKVPAAVLAGEEGAAERERGDRCGGSEGRRLLCVDEWRGSGRLWEMTGGVGEGRKRRAAVAWFVGGEEAG